VASPDTDELATLPLPAAPSAPPAAEPERIQPEPSEPEPSAPARPRGRWWRGITGSLAAGLAVLAVGILVVAGICLYTGAPGPGATLLIGHPVAAVLALVAQRVADRRDGPAAVGAGVAVALFTVSALTLFWLT
jgi:predicted lipid-binding transport protein (Tim44 family)